MTCKTAQRELAALLNGEKMDVPRQEVDAHVAGCAACRQAQQEMAAVWARLDRLEYEPVPKDLQSRTLRAVYREAAMEKAAPAGALTLRRLGSAVGAGILVALFYLYLIGLRVDFGYLSAAQLAVTAMIWSGLLVAAFCWILGRYRQWEVPLGEAPVLGIAGTGLSLAGTFLCPDGTFFDMWEKSLPSSMLAGVFEPGLGYMIFGFVYALLPALVTSVALGKRLSRRVWRNGLAAAGSFVFLLVPAAYLQCGSLAVGLFGMWTLGALIGATGGVFGGLEIRRTWPHKAAA